jgi:hypothetical protein
MLRCLAWQKFADVSEVLTASNIRAIDLMMAAVTTSVTSVNYYQDTRSNIQEDSQLHTLS